MYLMTGTVAASAKFSRSCCLLTRARTKSQNLDSTLHQMTQGKVQDVNIQITE